MNKKNKIKMTQISQNAYTPCNNSHKQFINKTVRPSCSNALLR